jgi:hypothetical protein
MSDLHEARDPERERARARSLPFSDGSHYFGPSITPPRFQVGW